MAVSTGNLILASDFNTLRGEVNRWFADNYAGTISFGNSNQTYGWGGSAASSVSTGNTMLASEMNALIDRCNIGVGIVDSVSGTLSQVSTGNLILASDFNNTETKSDSLTTDRLDITSGELSLHSGGSTQRTTSWSSAINCTFRYTFSSFDEARYFWNSGGAFNISGSISGYSTGTGYDGAGFNEIFTNMGTVTMDYTETVQSGSGGTPTSTGYYDLGTSYGQIFSQTGTGVYSNATLAINARYGSSGAYIELQVVLTPEAGRTVDGTTTITTQYRKLDDQSSGGASLTITAPSYSLQDGF